MKSCITAFDLLKIYNHIDHARIYYKFTDDKNRSDCDRLKRKISDVLSTIDIDITE